MAEPELFVLDPRAADRVLDQAFTVNRPRIERAREGFDARSLVTGWVGDDRAEEMSLAQVVSCIAYHAFINDSNIRRPAGFQFHKALLAMVAGGWADAPGVAVCLRHESAPGIPIIGSPRPAEEIYAEVDDTWDASYRSLTRALATLTEMGNELLGIARVSVSCIE